jgi:hypothetical protein
VGSLDSDPVIPRLARAALDVSMFGSSLSRLCLLSPDPSSTQPAGVGGMLSKLVPITGGGRLRVEICELRIPDVSDRPLTLCDLAVGGGPGGGGGSGIPGSQPCVDGE